MERGQEYIPKYPERGREYVSKYSLERGREYVPQAHTERGRTSRYETHYERPSRSRSSGYDVTIRSRSLDRMGSDVDRYVDHHTKRLLDFGHISDPTVMRLRTENVGMPDRRVPSYMNRFGRAASTEHVLHNVVADLDDEDKYKRQRLSRKLDKEVSAALKRKVEDVYDRFNIHMPSENASTNFDIKKLCKYDVIDGRKKPSKYMRMGRHDDLAVDRALSQTSRSTSLSRLDDTSMYDFDTYRPNKSRIRRALSDRNLNEITVYNSASDVNAFGGDINNFVSDGGVRFAPDEVEVIVLPTGKKAIQYSQSCQSGHGNIRDQNLAVQRVIEKTRFMQQSMTTLEDFVRRNRSLFPDDTRIYQRIRFFLLTEQQLIEIGERPDAEVYGVKITERLVVPQGTDIAHVLKRCYGKNDYQIQYGSREIGGRRYSVTSDLETSYKHLPSQIKSHRPEEFETSYRHLPSQTKPYRSADDIDIHLPKRRRPYEDLADRHIDDSDYRTRKHTLLTEPYKRSLYHTAGLAYDDIFTPHKSSYASSVASEESGRSSVSSRRRKRFDSAPTFTSKLRPKRCSVGGTVRFNCSVSGLPMPDVQWFKGSRVITDGGRFHITVSYITCIMFVCM